jgi:CheY-like chemotaxis protein
MAPAGTGTPEHRVVLVVDDDRDLRTVLLEALRHLGIGARGAVDGVDALEKARDTPPPCALLLDLDMPRLPGQGVVAELRRDPRLSRVPVITMTAGALPTGLETCGHLPKPFGLDHMLGALFRACRSCALCDGAGPVVGSIYTARRAAEQLRH